MTCCEACRAQLNIFIRKKCSACGQAHCSRCLTVLTPERASARSALMMRGRNRRVCVKCAILISGDYSRDDLATRYSVRELRMFLVSCKVTISGCTEKADLIELAMKASHAPTLSHGEDQEHAIHVARLKEKMMSEMQSTTATVAVDTHHDSTYAQSSVIVATDSSFVTTTDQQAVSGSQESSSSTVLAEQAETARTVADAELDNGMIYNVPCVDASVDSHIDLANSGQIDSQMSDETVTSTRQNIEGFSDSLPTTTIAITNTTTTVQSLTAAASPLKQSGEHRRVWLSEISDEASIELLTVRQLKELLANNFVDYKGCCEKPELVTRVRQLWTDHQRNTSYVNNLSTDGSASAADFDNNLCKICMDAVIDCLLLECGHMVTCGACGKRLAECPICRRYVVRVVHVFRA